MKVKDLKGFPKKKGLCSGKDFDKLNDCEYALKTELNIGFDQALDIVGKLEVLEKLNEEKLAGANGALSDIKTLVTSCISKRKNNKELHKIARAVLDRILCSCSMVHNKPTWYIHDWEKALYEDYLSGKTKACASNEPCINKAKRLAIVDKFGTVKKEG